MLPQELLAVASRFLGYGDPISARIWFVGIEEADPFPTKEAILALPQRPFVISEVQQGVIPRVYQIIGKIMAGLRGEDWETAWYRYCTDRLFRKGSEAIQMNLYPLGKPRIQDWPASYAEWFQLSRPEYYAIVQESDRFNNIREVCAQHVDHLTICFSGVEMRGDFLQVKGHLRREHGTAPLINIFIFVAKGM